MEYQDMKRPALSVFALAIILLLGLGGAFTGGESWQTAAGCVVLGSGTWAIWNVGRWAWWRYGPRHVVDAIR
jgi:glucose dehydrogenase